MLWNNLMCLNQFDVKTLSLEVWGSDPHSGCLGFQNLTMKFFILLKLEHK
jgi:hypothetical protein